MELSLFRVAWSRRPRNWNPIFFLTIDDRILPSNFFNICHRRGSMLTHRSQQRIASICRLCDAYLADFGMFDCCVCNSEQFVRSRHG